MKLKISLATIVFENFFLPLEATQKILLEIFLLSHRKKSKKVLKVSSSISPKIINKSALFFNSFRETRDPPNFWKGR